MKNFSHNDKLIFLGNIIGLGDSSKETLSSVIDLRFNLMSKFKLKPDAIVFLRGAQEEMFSKLLQLQLAPNPTEIVDWMFEHGVNKTINSYGFSEDEVKNIASSGTIKISKWTSTLNKSLQLNSGHSQYFLNLKHAAYSHTKKILFVNRGVDITRPLSAQNDCFWWGFQNFSKIKKPYKTFLRIVRGYESAHLNHSEISQNNIVCTLFKQPLTNKNILCGIFAENGEILDLFENN
jgi:serine/threonine protein phosphatase 1